VDFDSDCLKVVLVFLGGEGERYSNVGEIFRQFSYGAIMSVQLSYSICRLRGWAFLKIPPQYPSPIVCGIRALCCGLRTSWTLNCDNSRSDMDLDTLRYDDRLF